MKLPAEINITEQIVGEGFAAETNFIPTGAKVWLINEMIKAGSRSIQVSNFGNPKLMPQFRDCDEVYRQIGHPEGVTFQAPVLNMRALDRVIELRKSGYGPHTVEFLIATTDAFNKVNLGKTTAEQWKVFEPMVDKARDAGLKIMGGIGGIFSCLATGDKLPPEVAMEFAGRWTSIGVDKLTHAEGGLKGEPAPNTVYDYFSRMLDKYPDPNFHNLHLHDTYRWGVSCYIAAMQAGVIIFETCLGGLQGGPEPVLVDRVPVMPIDVRTPLDVQGAPRMGLIPTEDFVSICDAMGIKTGLDVDKVLNIGRTLEMIVGRKLLSTRLNW
ncbi:MAG TPA: pyruvate carboxyltransferase [Dehalococcoidia bacterium]|nr:pyruvate carboxyltransferase [Dehalococcoidia bacterium]